MTLKDQIDEDALNVFLSEDDFAEEITYTPYRGPQESAPAPRTISAAVFRDGLVSVGDDGGETVSPIFAVHVHNNSTTGISSDELDLGGDVLSFPMRDGETAQEWRITRLVTQDHGMLVLECQ